MATLKQEQLALALPPDAQLMEELILKKARELFERSRLLSSRYPSFARLMEDPLVGRCMRLSAAQCLRSGKRVR
jgi:hypothetical protein